MTKFRVKSIDEMDDAQQFGSTGTVVEGEIRAGMFLHVWINWRLYYPFRILTVEARDTAPGEVRLTLDSELGEKGLLSNVNLDNSLLTVSVDE